MAEGEARDPARDPQDPDRLVTDFAERVPDVLRAAVVASDGVLVAVSDRAQPDQLEQLSAITAALIRTSRRPACRSMLNVRVPALKSPPPAENVARMISLSLIHEEFGGYEFQDAASGSWIAMVPPGRVSAIISRSRPASRPTGAKTNRTWVRSKDSRGSLVL